jgi:hypothetical protein
MASAYQKPAFRLGVKSIELIAAYYDALSESQNLSPADLSVSGGTLYSDLKVGVNTFDGQGRIEITAGALVVDLTRLNLNDVVLLRDHLQLCEDTMKQVLDDVQLSERTMRANVWVSLEGGSNAASEFLSRRGNAAFSLNDSKYAHKDTEFMLQFRSLDLDSTSVFSFFIERSRAEGDLYIQFDHSLRGAPVAARRASDQVDDAREELGIILRHLGLVDAANTTT